MNWGTSQPFNGIPNAPNESYQSLGAEQWLPEVKAAVNDAVNQGLLNANERQLWENILLGQIDVESTGHAFLVNGNSPNYSQGLTQTASPWLEYAEEDPFDPLTNLRSLLRTEIRYYRKWGNRWDEALGEYLTGSEDPTCQETCMSGSFSGLTYSERVVNAIWWVHSNSQNGKNYSPQNNSYQGNCSGSTCWFSNAPTWNLWQSPNLAYNWVPPSNQNGYNYYTQGVDHNISLPISTSTWMVVPGWFYRASPEPSAAIYSEPAPTSLQSQQYPAGHTVLANGSYEGTYPRRTWSTSNP